MRIALVSTPFVAVPPRAYGGTELVVHELARGLVRAGHDVTLFATGDSRGPDVRWVFERAVWPPDEATDRIHARAAARAIRRERFDLVHAHTAALLRVPDDLGAPVVYTIHHVRDERLVPLYGKRDDATYVAISRRQAALSPDVRCHVVHHGLDPSAYPRGRGKGGYALFLGRLSWCKGPDLAVEAAAVAGVPLVVAGERHEEEGEPAERAEAVARALAAPGVRRVGDVGGARKLRLLGGARALLMPIRWEEPFGLTMIEAMLTGTPVVAFRRGAAPEIVDEGVTGHLVDDVDDMARALARADRLDRARCRERARERFSAARMVDDYLRVYAAAIAARAASLGGAAGEEETYAG